MLVLGVSFRCCRLGYRSRNQESILCHACKNYFGVGMFSPTGNRRYNERQMRGSWEVSLFILHGFGEVLLLMLYGFAKVAQGSHAKAS